MVYKKKAGGLLGLQAELADTSGVPTRSRHYRRNCILRKLQNKKRHWIWLEQRLIFLLNFQFWTLDSSLFQSLEVYSMTFLAHTHSPSFHSFTLPFSSFACLLMTTCLTFCSSGLSKDLRTLLINWPTESIAANGQKSALNNKDFL